ncbi:M57 family metalloprotease [Aquimarina sp. 2201CG5-10]|uniref:M57 family metalloprotease n=1 Tax=Aquimarina callyspongiae TaxID=3098150 RepID=UPI002AB35A36|nr:M57 family metalloprotease [Aquimarina sp. 2201CG5-10]MDY8134202.1 M57 family metalloprotease [Aquimarina sp. 2201CG5-10]
MKRNVITKTLYYLICSLLLISCENESDEIFTPENSNLNQSDFKKLAQDNHPVVQLLYSRGYEKGSIYETKDHFLAPPDLLYSKDISDYSEANNENRQAYNTGKIVSLDRMRIRVFLDNSINATLRNDAVNAMNSWNGINNCALFFERVFNSGDANITIRSDFGVEDPDVLGRAGFPSNGIPFGTVTLNVDELIRFGATIRRNVVIHELGHCVGFRHTDWRANGEGGAINIPGTTENDTQSIMWHTARGGGAFSNGDLIASRALFPRALRLSRDLDYSDFSYPDFEESYSVFVDVFTNGSYTTTANLNRNVAISYLIRVQEYNHTSGSYNIYRNRNLNAGANRYFMDNEEEQCTYLQGETCTEETLEIRLARSIL